MTMRITPPDTTPPTPPTTPEATPPAMFFQPRKPMRYRPRPADPSAPPPPPPTTTPQGGQRE
jgi:hypothetical protein